MNEIFGMTLAQIKRYTLEITNQKISEQSAMIGVVAVGSQGTKDSIKQALSSMSESQKKLSQKARKSPKRLNG